MSDFAGFPKEGLKLLAELPDHDTEWFHANKKRYQQMLAEPAKDFVVALGERLKSEISEGIEAVPRTNGSIAPINNDTRFRKDAPTYKDHLMFRFWEGPTKKTAPLLMIRLGAKDIGFSAGMPFDDVERWREAIADETTGSALAASIAELSKGRDVDIAGPATKRVPTPHPQDHPRAELLKLKGFQVRWMEPKVTATTLSSPELVDLCAARLGELADVHRWLVANMA